MVLIIERGPDTGRRWSVDKPAIIIGRAAGCDVSLQDERVSGRHAQLWRQGHNWIVKDLNSRNGVWVNRQKLNAPHTLQIGDQLGLGGTVFTLQWAREPPAQCQRAAGSLGDMLVGLADVVIALLNKSNAEKQKLNCACMGSNIFETCLAFPGIQNEDFYTAQAQADLDRPAPARPPKSTPYPSPTPYPTLTPLPTPANPQDMGQYMDDSKEQGEEYAKLRQEQGDQYQQARESQGDQYEAAVTQWGEDKGGWDENRQKSIGGAEGLLKGVFEAYGHAFQGSCVSRWAWMSGIMAVLLAAVILFQRAKDTI